MSLQPMLGPRAPPMSDAGRCCAACRASAAQWWATITAEEYLCSPVSRRILWKFYYVIAGLGVLVDVVSYGQDWVRGMRSHTMEALFLVFVMDIGEVLFSVLLRCLPAWSLKSDLAILAVMLLQSVVYLGMEPSASLDRRDRDAYALCLIYKLVLCCALGINSLCMISYGSVTLLISAARCDWKPMSTTSLCEAFCMAAMIMAVMTVLEGLLAHHFRELRERLSTIQNLLDKATDGFCTIGRSTGTVTDVSQSLMHLFGTDLLGAQILNFVDPNDRAKVARLFNDSWSDIDIAEPVMATFTQRRPGQEAAAVEFEAKLVPYRATDTDVHVVFQIVGEIRPSRHPAVDAATKPLPEAPAASGAGRDRPAGSREKTLDRLEISFDSGHPSFLIGDSECSRELLPRQGKLIHWFPRHARSLVERWITSSVNQCNDEGLGLCPRALENFELVLPPVPAIKVKANKAFLLKEQSVTNEDGSVSLPAVLCLVRVTISKSLPAIPEELPPKVDGEDGLTSEGSESVTGSDSASVAMMKFREVASPSFSSSSRSTDRPPGC